ncbi:MAG TPA: hypothetical protein PK667_12625 [Nitrosomonas europaea]|uniref:hypothetical protein n=1 Tax=Betaproteobacteria TaxID=28216 RepID=UPI002BBD0D50|nr:MULTISPECIES: hypothetical protein [Betaproteobacteria]HRN82839.1 hypothetical protein [Nitrosomonas europaea]HRO22634.1 hypothetical protein [Alcaligenes phenolicus]HUM75015.1 hypothetical protein [Nitrosomonas europaea]
MKILKLWPATFYLNLKKHLLSLFFIILATISFMVLYEHFPKPGWADPAIYNSYAVFSDAYSYVDGFGQALNGATYQGSRLGHIIPLKFISELLGAVEGRLVYNTLLFLLFCISVIKITSIYVKSLLGQILVCGYFLLNPQFVSSIVSGSTDGPAATYSLTSLVCLLFALRNKSNFLSGLAGVCFGLALSTHVFSLIPYFLALIALSFSGRILGERQKLLFYGKHVLWFLFGLALIILMFSLYARHLGLEKFYLAYNFGRIQASIQGSGAQFWPPLYFWLQQATLWIGIIFLFVYTLFVNNKGISSDGCHEKILRRKIAILSFLLPLLFVFIFDFLIGGSMITSPHYFNAFFPCFVVGSIFLVSSWDYDLRRNAAFLVSIFFSFSAAFFLPDNYSLFSFNKIDSKDLLISQQHLDYEISRLVKNKNFNLVYSIADENDRQHAKHVDYFNGEKRIFDYLDSLAYIFPWVGDKMYRVDLRNLAETNVNLVKDLPTIILSRTENQLGRTLGMVQHPFGDFSIVRKKCGGHGIYQWCILVIENG